MSTTPADLSRARREHLVELYRMLGVGLSDIASESQHAKHLQDSQHDADEQTLARAAVSKALDKINVIAYSLQRLLPPVENGERSDSVEAVEEPQAAVVTPSNKKQQQQEDTGLALGMSRRSLLFGDEDGTAAIARALEAEEAVRSAAETAASFLADATTSPPPPPPPPPSPPKVVVAGVSESKFAAAAAAAADAATSLPAPQAKRIGEAAAAPVTGALKVAVVRPVAVHVPATTMQVAAAAAPEDGASEINRHAARMRRLQMKIDAAASPSP